MDSHLPAVFSYDFSSEQVPGEREKEGGGSLSFSSYKGTNLRRVPHIGPNPNLIISQRPPPPNIITLVLRASIHDIQSKTEVKSFEGRVT